MLLGTNSYLTAAQFKAQPNDQDLTSYTDAQITDILARASGKADSIMRRSMLGKERVIRMNGSGTNKLELNVAPILYVKKIQIVIPGTTGPVIPISQILIDFSSGSVLEYTPMLFNGQGYFARFPSGVPCDLTIGTGYTGFAFSPPAYTTADGTATGLTAGVYNLAITTKTMWGETSASVKQYTTASGSFASTITPTLGGYLYRAYASSGANNTTVNGATLVGATSFVVAAIHGIAVGDTLLIGSGATAEYAKVLNISTNTITCAALTYAHANGETVIEQPLLVAESPFTAYGATGLAITVNSLSLTSGIWQDAFPLADTSMPVLPQAVIEAVRLLALSIIWEQNNLANRGLNLQYSGDKRLSWRSTEGTSGKGVPLAEEQAMALLAPYKLQGIFSGG